MTSISLIGTNTAQATRLNSLNFQLQDLQRQLATQRENETLSGFGSQAFRIQDLRAEADRLNVFQENISRVTTRVDLILNATNEVSRLAQEVEESILIQTREGDVDVRTINDIAQANLRFFNDLLNTQDGARFLLAGTDTENAPFESLTNLQLRFQNEISDFLDGTQTVNDLITDINNLTPTDLGLSASLSSASGVSTQIDDNVVIDYTAQADEEGFLNILRGVALAQALTQPDPAVDVATQAEFQQVLDESVRLIREGVDQLGDINSRLGAEFSLIENIRTNNENDLRVAEIAISELEDVDTTDVVVQLQALQTQLSASFQATRIVSELSLVNFI